ncbi:MAG: hypothetical protein PVG14_17730 [Anaerolineales bacterium]|jgi:hypothetical protein
MIVYPHGLFRTDFEKIIKDAERQERIHPANTGEKKLVLGMRSFFDWHVIRLVKEDDWVYEAALEFAQYYAMDCFRYLKLGGRGIYTIQKRLHELNEQITDIITKAAKAGAIPVEGQINLTKGSDFLSLINLDKLDEDMIREVEELHEKTLEQEDLQLWITLHAIRDSYETTLPRIMFVIRRVIKIMKGLEPELSDNNLTGISEYLDWYESHIDSSHLLFPVIGKLRSFYKVARNVASHHKGMTWDEKDNLVILDDQSIRITLPVHEFQQRYRYLVYLCELGLRGILAAFCERERGEISDNLVREYAKTFPEDFPEGIPSRVRFYIP